MSILRIGSTPRRAAAFAAAVLAALAVPFSAAAAGPPDQVDCPAPEFRVKDLTGIWISSADLKGKIVVVNFWASWCPPCRDEIPDLVRFYRDYKAKGVEIVGLSVDEMTAEALLAFVRRNGITYPVAFADAGIVRDFEPGGYIPTTFIIDPRGRIRHKQVGPMDRATLASWFEKLAGERRGG